jgi:hypothetical protein
MTDWRFRTTWRGLLILQRRIRTMRVIGPTVEPGYEWRDASAKDLAQYYRDLHTVGKS